MLSVATVRAWRPEALGAAADGFAKAAGALDDEINTVRKAMDRAGQDWRGDDADAAAERTRREVRDGRELLDALTRARDVLRSGAEHIGTTRAELLVAVDAVLGRGLGVAADGTVTPAPSALSEGAAAAARDIAAAHATTQGTADPALATLGASLERALRAVADADHFVAETLSRIEVPASMQTEVDRILARAAAGEDVSTLLAWGVGGLRLAQVGVKAFGTKGKTVALVRYFHALGRSPAAAAAALDAFVGVNPTGVMGRLADLRVVGPVARVASRAYVPLTFASGTRDAITGGGYDGGRAWAARGFGVAGAVGSVGMAAGAGWLGTGAMTAMLATAGPVGVGIAGAAVAAYGAWQLGNLVYDHREAIGQFATKLGEAGGAAVDLSAYAVDEATQWAGDRLADAGDWAGDRLGDVADLGKKLMPVKMPDLNPF